jgi:peptide/nickel transport system substrate-binding protein
MSFRRTVLAALALATAPAGLGVADARAQDPVRQVRLPLPQYDGTLTPYTFESAYPLVTLVYDTLLWRDARGVPRPWLAESVTRSANRRRVTIRLRKGARWHDGRPLTSDDVAFTFDFVRGRFHPRFTPQLADVESVRAQDQRTVTIDLARPSLGFEDQPLADLPILPRHLWLGLPAGRAPAGPAIGSGPYRLEQARRRTGYRFRANRAYFRGRPRVERIRVPIIRQESRTYSALRRRNVDMLPVTLPERAVERLGGSFGINIASGTAYSGTALLFNLRRPPFNRPGVRRALARSIELRRIVRNVGPGVAAERGYIHPDSRWAPKVRLHRFSLDAARRAISRLNLPAVKILAPDNDPVRRTAGRQVALAMRRAGVDAEAVEVSRSRLGQAIGEDGSAAAFDAAIVSMPPLASYDPDFLQRVFGSNQATAPLNYAGYRSQEFDRLAGQVASAPNRSSRRRAVTAELRLLAADLPALPLFFPEGRFAYRPAIHNGWLYVKGSGILDKRSFMRTAPASTTRGAPDGEDTDDGSSFLDILRVASLAVLLIALALGAYGLLERQKTRRR